MMFQATFADTAVFNLADPVEDMLALGKDRIDLMPVAGEIEKRESSTRMIAASLTSA